MVDLVGAGPGDPSLLTLAAVDALNNADVVVVDHLIPPRVLERIPPTARRVFVGKHRGHAVLTQSEINRLLVAHARAGQRVVRLKGGDPYIFGRGAEEALYLRRAGVPFRVIPGITAALGAAAYAGVPLTHRHQASTVVLATGHHDPEDPDGPVDWTALARAPGTLVVYMGLAHLDALCRTLIAAGRPAETPAAVIQNGTRPDQLLVEATLSDLAAKCRRAGVGSPALVVIGHVVGHHRSLGWHARLPLAGRRIVVTRPDREDLAADDLLERLGAEVLRAPMLVLGPPEDLAPLDRAIAGLGQYDWVIFTSVPGVRGFFERLKSLGRDARQFGAARVAAIGETTRSALEQAGLRADLVPTVVRSEGLLAELLPRVRGARVLLARADRGRPLLREALAPVCQLDEVAVYRHQDAPSLPSSVQSALVRERVDWVTITSPAIVDRLHALLPPQAREQVGRRIQLASISPLTTEAATRRGWPVAAEAATPSWPALVQALVEADARLRGPATPTAPTRSGKLAIRLQTLPQDERSAERKQDIEHQVRASERNPQRQVEDEHQGQKARNHHRNQG
jgi:uroporphyrinogen III methyltransferase/synthase